MVQGKNKTRMNSDAPEGSTVCAPHVAAVVSLNNFQLPFSTSEYLLNEILNFLELTYIYFRQTKTQFVLRSIFLSVSLLLT